MSKRQLGMRVDGGFFNEDGSDLTWDNFIEKIEKVGLSYTGKTLPLDDEGNIYELKNPWTWELGKKVEE